MQKGKNLNFEDSYNILKLSKSKFIYYIFIFFIYFYKILFNNKSNRKKKNKVIFINKKSLNMRKAVILRKIKLNLLLKNKKNRKYNKK